MPSNKSSLGMRLPNYFAMQRQRLSESEEQRLLRLEEQRDTGVYLKKQ